MTPNEWAINTRNSLSILSELPDKCVAMEILAAKFREAEERVRRETIETCLYICRTGKESVRGNPKKDYAFWAFDWCEVEISTLLPSRPKGEG